MAGNLFDQFDADAGASATQGQGAQPAAESSQQNVFDQFDAPKQTAQAAKAPQGSVSRELVRQPLLGFNEGLDDLYNFPNYLVNAGAKALGYEPPMHPVRIASKFNEPDPWRKIANDVSTGVGASAPFKDVAPDTGGEEPTTGVGRYARSIGQQAGASVLPMTGMMARGIIPATGRVMAQNAASVVGAGTGQQIAKDEGAGPLGQTFGALVGGFAAPPLYNTAAKVSGIGKNAVNYGRMAVEEGRNPQLGSDRTLNEALRQAGTSPEELREIALPKYPPQSSLPSRGFTVDHLAEMIGRSLDGEDFPSIASDFNGRGLPITADTVKEYVSRYRVKNPTPMTMMDYAEEAGGPGAAMPLTRLARREQIISGDVEPFLRLNQRRIDQPARVTGMIDNVLPEAATAEEMNAAERAAQQRAVGVINQEYPAQNYEEGRARLSQVAQQQARANYDRLHALPAIPADQDLAGLLSTRLGASAYDQAVESAAAEGNPIPTREELLRTFGINPKPGLGLSPAGVPTEPQQYPVAPGTQPGPLIPVRALDYFQRALRRSADAGFRSGDPQAFDYNVLRQRFIEHLDPTNPDPARPTLVPGFRDTMGSYRTGMGHQEALDAGATLEPKLNENTYNTLASFEKMNPVEQELFRLRFARKMQDTIQNQPFGSDALGEFDTPAGQTIIGRVFPQDTADRIISGLERERLTAQAPKLGEQLANKMGSDPDPQELRLFNSMDDQQKELFKGGFSRGFRARLGRKAEGNDAVSQFNNENTRQIIRGVLSEKEANDVIRNVRRESTANKIMNAIYANSNTAQTEYDINTSQNAANAITSMGTLNPKRYFDSWFTALARKIGQERATAIVKDLTETDPANQLRLFERLMGTKPSPMERDMLSIFRGPARSWGPGRGWMAGQTAETLKGVDQSKGSGLGVSSAKAAMEAEHPDWNKGWGTSWSKNDREDAKPAPKPLPPGVTPRQAIQDAQDKLSRNQNSPRVKAAVEQKLREYGLHPDLLTTDHFQLIAPPR